MAIMQERQHKNLFEIECKCQTRESLSATFARTILAPWSPVESVSWHHDVQLSLSPGSSLSPVSSGAVLPQPTVSTARQLRYWHSKHNGNGVIPSLLKSISPLPNQTKLSTTVSTNRRSWVLMSIYKKIYWNLLIIIEKRVIKFFYTNWQSFLFRASPQELQ